MNNNNGKGRCPKCGFRKPKDLCRGCGLYLPIDTAEERKIREEKHDQRIEEMAQEILSAIPPPSPEHTGEMKNPDCHRCGQEADYTEDGKTLQCLYCGDIQEPAPSSEPTIESVREKIMSKFASPERLSAEAKEKKRLTDRQILQKHVIFKLDEWHPTEDCLKAMRKFAAQETAEKGKEIASLKDALTKIVFMKVEDGENYMYPFNRCWHIATNALNPTFEGENE